MIGCAELWRRRAEPCPVCDLPCTGTYTLSYRREAQVVRFEMAHAVLEGRLSARVEATLGSAAYAELPEPVREWNECRGWWADCPPPGLPLSLSQARRLLGLADAPSRPPEDAIGRELQAFLQEVGAQPGARLLLTAD